MTQFLCYECQVLHPAIEMQDYEFVLCGGRKCKALHGGEGKHFFSECKQDNLCADCVSFGKCCGFPCCGEYHLKVIGVCPTCKTPWQLQKGGMGWMCEKYEPNKELKS